MRQTPPPSQTPLKKIGGMLKIGTTGTVANDNGQVQTIQVVYNKSEVRPDTPVLLHFGFSSSPPRNSDVLTVALNGDASKCVVIGSNHQTYRYLGLPEGGSVMFDMAGSTIVLDAQGHITLTPKSGNVSVVGTVTATDFIAGGLHFLTHKHGQVAAGTAETSAPNA